MNNWFFWWLCNHINILFNSFFLELFFISFFNFFIIGSSTWHQQLAAIKFVLITIYEDPVSNLGKYRFLLAGFYCVVPHLFPDWSCFTGVPSFHACM